MMASFASVHVSAANKCIYPAVGFRKLAKNPSGRGQNLDYASVADKSKSPASKP